MRDTPCLYTCPLERRTRYSLFNPLTRLVALLAITYLLLPVQHNLQTLYCGQNSPEYQNLKKVVIWPREYYLTSLLNSDLMFELTKTDALTCKLKMYLVPRGVNQLLITSFLSRVKPDKATDTLACVSYPQKKIKSIQCCNNLSPCIEVQSSTYAINFTGQKSFNFIENLTFGLNSPKSSKAVLQCYNLPPCSERVTLKDNTNINEHLKIDASPEVNGFDINNKSFQDYKNLESDCFESLTERVVSLHLTTSLEDKQHLTDQYFCSSNFGDCLNFNRLLGWIQLKSFVFTSSYERKMVIDMTQINQNLSWYINQVSEFQNWIRVRFWRLSSNLFQLVSILLVMSKIKLNKLRNNLTNPSFKFKIILLALILAQFFQPALSDCDEINEVIQFNNTCPTTPYYYVIGAPNATAANYTFTSTDSDCYKEERFFYDQAVVTPPVSGVFFFNKTLDYSTVACNCNYSSQVTWYSKNLSKSGTYTVSVRGYVIKKPPINITYKTCTWTVVISQASGCSTSPENPINVTKSSPPSLQSYSIKGAAGSVTISQFTENSIYCTPSDIVYSMTVSDSGSSFVSFDATNRIVSWQTNSCTVSTTTYTITITGKIIIAGQTFQDFLHFSLVVSKPSCACSNQSFNVITASTTPKTYTIDDTQGSYTISAFTLSSNSTCTANDIVYTMAVTPSTTGQSTSFITLMPSTRTASWESTSSSDVGTFTISIIGTVYTHSPATHENTATYTLTVIETCVKSKQTITITPSPAPGSQNYVVAAGQITFSQFTSNSNICTQSDIVYSMTVTPSESQATDFITLTQSTRIVAWSVTTNAQIGTYTIRITGTIKAATIWSNYFEFQLIVTGSCPTSIESNQLVASTAPAAQTYTVGASSSSLTIDQFTVNSAYCTQSAITYLMLVTSTPAGLSTTFISFDTGQRLVTWVTNNNSQIGTYTIKITGQIQTLTLWTQTISFTLEVVASCSSSSETITISAGTSVENQIYALAVSQASVTIPQFTENSAYCTSDSIVYSMIVTAPNGVSSTSFITFTQATREVSWSTNDFSQVGTYQIFITGTIVAQSTFTHTSTFMLIVYATCSQSTETNILTAGPAPSSQSYTVGSTQASEVILPFGENSVVCNQNDIVYTMTITPSSGTSFITFTISSLTVAWQTNSNLDAGTYTIFIVGTIQAATTWTQTIQFTLTVTASCSKSAEGNQLVASANPSAQTYAVGANSLSLIITEFTQTSAYCTQADITYSMTVTPTITGTSTQFIQFTPATRTVTWQTNDNVQAGTYSISIKGEINIQGAAAWLQNVSFLLTVTPTCSRSTETITLTIVTPNTNYNYIVGSAQYSTIAQFSHNSIYCQDSDIVYSIAVTTSGAGSTSIITFNSSTKNLSWFTNSNTNAGTYTITLTGSIQATQAFSQTNQFTLTVIGSCDQSTGFIVSAPLSLTGMQSETITYIQGQPLFNLQIYNFTENDPYCTSQQITYSSTVTPTTPSQDSSFIIYNSLSNTISCNTNFAKDAGVYSIQIKGQITTSFVYTNFASASLTLIVISAECSTSSEIMYLTPPEKPQNQVYIITHAEGQLQIGDFTENSTFCTSQDIAYQMHVTTQSQEQQIKFIKLNVATRVISWLTFSNLDAGNYTIQILATLNTFNNSVSFLLEVQMQPVNNPPVLSGLKSFYPTILLSDLIQDTYNLGPVTDPETSDTVTLTYTVQPASGKSYFKIDLVTGELWVTDRKGLVSGAASTYQIKVFLKDSNIVIPGNSTYIITFDVQNNKKAKESQISSKNFTVQKQNISIPSEDFSKAVPYWKRMTISNEGQIKIYFSEQLVIPANVTLNINSSVLNVEFITQSSAYAKYQKFTWNLTEFQNSYMTLQLVFQNPLYISALGKTQLDSLIVTCLDKKFFLSKKSLQVLKENQSLKQQIPPQLSSDKELNAKMQTVKKTMETGSNSIVIGTFITNLILSTSINLLWGMINALQIIGNMPKFYLYIPANVLDFYEFISNLQSFNFLPTDQIFVWMGLASVQEDNINASNNPVRSLVQEDADLQATYNIFQQLGPLFLVLLVFSLLFLVLMVLFVLRKALSCLDKSFIVKKLYDKIHFKLFWNSTLRYIIESYLALTLQSLTLMHQGLDWFNGINIAQAIFSIVTMIICGVAPAGMTFFFIIKIQQFRDKVFLSRFGSIIGDFNFREKMSSVFISIFCYRRLIEVLLIVFVSSYPYAQVQLMTLSCVLAVILFGYSNAYRMSRNRQLEFFNEATILICCYHLFCFTDFVDDPTMRYQIGFSLIFFTTFNIGVNVSVMVFETIINLIRMQKVIRQRCRKLKHTRKIRRSQKGKQKIKSSWKDSYMTKEAFDEQAKRVKKDIELYYELFPDERRLDQLKAKEQKKTNTQHQQIDKRRARKLRKTLRIMQQATDNQLKVIKEAASDQEYSDRQNQKLQTELEILAKTKPTQKLTAGMTSIHPQQEYHQQRNDSWTNFYAPMFQQFPAIPPVQIELSKEEQQRRRSIGVKMQKISAEYDLSFRESSQNLFKDIQQTEKNRGLNTPTKVQREIHEIAKLLQINQGLVNTAKSINESIQVEKLDIFMENRSTKKKVRIFDLNDDQEYQFAVGQKKGK